MVTLRGRREFLKDVGLTGAALTLPGLLDACRDVTEPAPERVPEPLASVSVAPGPGKIDAYSHRLSYAPSEPIQLHVSSQDGGPFRTTLYRVSGGAGVAAEETLYSSEPDTAPDYYGCVPDEPFTAGCAWPLHSCQIPGQSLSGLYYVRLTRVDAQQTEIQGEYTDIPIVVRPSTPSSDGVLVVVETTTAQAYNLWGGNNLYGPVDGTYADRAREVSFARPYAEVIGLPAEYHPRGGQISRWHHKLARWLREQPERFDYCTSTDLHRGVPVLDPYNLLLFAGHEEYWSMEMRNACERFLDGGGNIAFLGGNLVWWRVVLNLATPPNQYNSTPAAGSSMVCKKNAAEDPVTVEWYKDPSGPEDGLTGVSSRRGAFHPAPQPDEAFQVFAPEHWAFAGLGLTYSQSFGMQCIGYETDAAPCVENDQHQELTDTSGLPILNVRERDDDQGVRDATPRSLVVLAASSQLGEWSSPGGNESRHATMTIHRRDSAPTGRTSGTVVTAGTTDWASNLDVYRNDQNVRGITRRIIDHLKVPLPGHPVVLNGQFDSWPNYAPANWAWEGGIWQSTEPDLEADRPSPKGLTLGANGFNGNYEAAIWQSLGWLDPALYVLTVWARIRQDIGGGSVTAELRSGNTCVARRDYDARIWKSPTGWQLLRAASFFTSAGEYTVRLSAVNALAIVTDVRVYRL